LKASILSPTSPEFKQRHPRLSRLLSHKLAPPIGASLAGLALTIGPADERRLTITIYTLAKALEYLYNRVEDLGHMKNKPWVILSNLTAAMHLLTCRDLVVWCLALVPIVIGTIATLFRL